MQIFNNQIVRNKPICYFDIFGLGSALGGLFSASASTASTAMQIKSNEKMQREAQGFTRSEREASQLYQTAEREAQNLWQQQQYLDYNSPQALAAQYAAAGLNPQLAIEGGSQGVQASSGSSGGAPSGSVVSPPYQNVQSPIQGFEQLANALAKFADAKKTGVESNILDQAMEDIVKKYKTDAEMSEWTSQIQFNKAKASAHDLEQKLAEIALLRKNGEKVDKEIYWLEQKGFIEHQVAENWLHTWAVNLERTSAETRNLNASTRNLNENVDLIRASTSEKRSQIEVNRSMVQLNMAKRSEALANTNYIDVVTNTERIAFRLRQIDLAIREANSVEEQESLRQTYLKTGELLQSQINQLQSAADLAKEKKDYVAWREITAGIKDLATTYRMVSGSKTDWDSAMELVSFIAK